ncbi:unnamed protein product (mitochondrion) [Plasmodiophora brassicae]|uniref:Uncharacterized protein n=1 Tax=Plasmodiophora brassicae TaxID=37360 RepID=A0A0G4IQY3_PLABS|nr:hypothetical protein PBRA_000891 [Plasmodiophora brassicae]SPQ97851.1 unnamed protein product [Plasmodiophora brassicae]
MWFSYWEERLGSDCLRCRQVLDTASLAGFGREMVIRIGNQIQETWMASQVGAVETTLADPDRPSCASTVPASLSHRLERLEAQQREILRGLAAIRAAQDQRNEGSASATTACTLPSGPVALSSATTAGTLPSGPEALSWTSTFPEELLSLAKVPVRKIFFAAHTTGLMTAADVPEEQRKRAGRVRSKCSTLLMPLMNHFAPKPVAPRPTQDASAHDVVQWRLKLTRIALASETKAKAWIEESSGRQVHSAGA